MTILDNTVKRLQLFILILVALDLTGFGMIIADIQIRAERFGAAGWMIGAVLSSMFVVQFFLSPVWGAISDRIGHKPVVIACTILSAVSMLTYALAGSIGVIFVSRIIAGVAAANVAVAQAWISQATPKEDRTAVMGKVGAAISGGLIVGPAIGGLLAHRGGNFLVGIVAGCLSFIGVAAVVWATPHKPKDRQQTKAGVGVQSVFAHRDLVLLLALAAVAWLALACLEGTFARLLERQWNQDQRAFGVVFGFESAISLSVQAWLIAIIAKRVSDAALVRWGLVLQGIGLASLPFFPVYGLVFIGAAVYSFGSAIFGPSLNAWCSKVTTPETQGSMFGMLQSARSLAFIVAPTFGGWLFDLRPWLPYLMAGGVCLIASVAAELINSKVGRQHPSPSNEN